MRTLKELLPHKRVSRGGRRQSLDEKTVFYIAKKVIEDAYGSRGGENIVPALYKDKKLFLSVKSSLWGNEVWLDREHLREKMNVVAGSEAIQEIRLERD